MATRRTTAPRTRPAPAGDARVRVPQVTDEAVVETAANAVALDQQDLGRDLLSQFEEFVRNDPSIDEGSRADLIEAFATSLRDTIDSDQGPGIPDEAELQEALEAFKSRSRAIDGESGGLERMLAGAATMLEQRETKVAIEFSRRLQTDGQESALAWLREQQHSGESAESQKSEADLAPVRTPALRSEVTSSRSRRLRGPPKG